MRYSWISWCREVRNRGGCSLGAAVQISLKLQATTATSCVEISDCEEAAMELSSEEDKVPTDGGTQWVDVGWMDER